MYIVYINCVEWTVSVSLFRRRRCWFGVQLDLSLMLVVPSTVHSENVLIFVNCLVVVQYRSIKQTVSAFLKRLKTLNSRISLYRIPSWILFLKIGLFYWLGDMVIGRISEFRQDNQHQLAMCRSQLSHLLCCSDVWPKHLLVLAQYCDKQKSTNHYGGIEWRHIGPWQGLFNLWRSFFLAFATSCALRQT